MRAEWVSSGNRRGLQVTQSQSAGGVAGGVAGQVLPGQHHLHQRVMGQAAGGVEPLDEDLEGHILVLVGGQAARPNLREKFCDRRIPVDLDPQYQGVDEEADQLVERGITAAGDRKANGHIGTGAELGQQHRQRGLYHHEAGRVVVARHPGNLLLQLGRPLQLDDGSALIGDQRIRPIGRQAAGAPAAPPEHPPSKPAVWRWRLSPSPRSPNCARCQSV